MKFEISGNWSRRMALREGDCEVGAGLLAAVPETDDETVPAGAPVESAIAFGRFVRLMRRSRGLTVERLATVANLDLIELVSIEEDAHFRPEVRTVYQLSTVFGVSRSRLLQVAGLATATNERVYEEAVRFAARSEPVNALTPEEREALETFVAVLSDRK